ncbi:DUF3152 domain-containing protein [Arsenicicoccus sp. oral taxon 190]|uniref:DUF3152 domain-containing protein n=1 Tax=Arsenicicoccus sp. oral taxon 190 TaxID=1658671 RepID=UPI00067A2EE3|nr:DUF3152 domain-containing protein [Arsenicicoccus sp. oral taxon 190]AKT52903.1 hypothetical protein ADJ73_14865 [Arsenicicoccus sp. oral taxon 190]
MDGAPVSDPGADLPETHPWSRRRRARFVRTLLVLLALLLTLLVATRWWAGRDDGGADKAATPRPAASSAPTSDTTAASALPGSTSRPAAAPSPGLDDDHDGTRGIYGDVSPDIPQKARGTFTVLPGASSPASQDGRVVRYTIEVEDGLGLDAGAFARTVRATLLDPRNGWQARDHVRWVAVSPQQAAAGEPVDIRVTLASPRTVDQGCAPLNTNGVVSCFNRGRAMLNAQRWVTGAYTYGQDLRSYRTYQINHEVGHGLGHDHVPCPAPGRRAPVMLQQTKTLQGCTAWPYPLGA